MTTDAVGALEITAALVVSAFGFVLIGFHEKDFPFLIVYQLFSKAFKDQEAGSIIKSQIERFDLTCVIFTPTT